jgi:hypothetical protein
LRLLNKRVTYAVESLSDLFSEKSLAKHKSVL